MQERRKLHYKQKETNKKKLTKKFRRQQKKRKTIENSNLRVIEILKANSNSN